MGKRSVRLGGEDGKDGIFLERVNSGARWEIFSMWSKRCAVGLTEQGDRAIREGGTNNGEIGTTQRGKGKKPRVYR
jgi:hypothetical protein